MSDAPQALRHFRSASDLDLATFADLCAQETPPQAYPRADRLLSRVPIYRGEVARSLTRQEASRRQLLDEWHHCLLEGPGVLVIEGMYPDTGIVDAASDSFLAIIDAERAAGGRGDHFAPPGSNDRIWNAFQKHGLRDPEGFLAYYANPLLALVSEAWLGQGYQISAQVNVVKPGGQAQRPHRDYHLGFQPAEAMPRFPLPLQVASQLLTLQGAIAHSDMPVESGPTRLLPYSQRYPEGYLAYREPEFQAHFDAHFVQLPLNKGDGLFFNPALLHAAGDNRSEQIERMANLLQVSSAFGRTMEAIDTHRLMAATYPALQRKRAREGMSGEVQAAIAAVAQGYAFPANLDKTPPQYGMAPETEQDLLRRALEDGWSGARLNDALGTLAEARLP